MRNTSPNNCFGARSRDELHSFFYRGGFFQIWKKLYVFLAGCDMTALPEVSNYTVRRTINVGSFDNANSLTCHK